MAVISPPDEVGRLSVLAVNLQDLGSLLVFTDAVALDDQSVACFGVHLHLRDRFEHPPFLLTWIGALGLFDANEEIVDIGAEVGTRRDHPEAECRMAHRVLSHTADTGIEATADTLSMLIHELAAGMFGLIAVLDPGESERWVAATVESTSIEDLVVDSLSELLGLAEVDDLVLCDFRVTTGEGPFTVNLEAGGVPADEVQPEGPPIKAVTYHGLRAEETEDGWYGRVYFDV